MGPEIDYISNIIENFKNHPSILRIKKKVKIEEIIPFFTCWWIC